MKRLLSDLVTVLILLSSYTEARTYFNRAKGPLPSFDDALNVPKDSYIDDGVAASSATSSDDFNAAGVAIDISSFGAQIFGTAADHLLCFDTGYCDCGATAPTASTLPTVTSNGMAIQGGRCMIAPFIMAEDNTQFKYHMAYRTVDKTLTQNKHDTDRISAEINTALHQYRTTWETDKAIIITWKIEGKGTAGDINHFQAILSVGGGTTYILFLYGTLPNAGNGVQGFVNGASGPFARICSEYAEPGVETAAPVAQLTTNANYRCGNKGGFVFDVHDAASGCTNAASACVSESKPNCNQTNQPTDTCTETYHCVKDGNSAEVNITMSWYKHGTLMPLQYDEFIGTADGGTVDDPLGKQVPFVEVQLGSAPLVCSATMPDADTILASYTHTMNIPVSLPTAGEVECGMWWDPTAQSLSFAFKNYDGTEINKYVDQEADLVIYGTCILLPSELTQTVDLNDIPTPTVVPPRSRTLNLKFIDRDVATDAQELTSVRVGRDIYLLVTFIPGTPFNFGADAFGAAVQECDAANNPDFVDETGTSWKRMERFISNGCPVAAASLEAISLVKSFEADPNHIPAGANNPDGSPWYQVSGVIHAAKWTVFDGSTPKNDIYVRCYVKLCIESTEVASCKDNCDSDKRKRRSAGDDDNYEVLYTRVTVEDEEPPTETKERQCANFNTAMTTMMILLAMLLLVSTLCILLLVKLTSLRTIMRRKGSTKKAPL